MSICIHYLKMFVAALFFFLCYCVLPNCGSSCFNREGIVARLPGDIIIGGLFAIHTGVSNVSDRIKPADFNCSGFDLKTTVSALSMIYTIEQINNSTLLPGITLGYEIYDTCSDVSKAIQGTMRMMNEFNSSHENSAQNVCNEYVPVVKAVVGERYSEISVAVSRLLSLYLIPQISYASSASILNDTVKYPSFLRTVTSDIYQTKAVAKLLSALKWNWVGIISSNDDYGRSAMESLSNDLEEESICIAFKESVPYYVNHPKMDLQIKRIIQKMQTVSTAKVIIAFSKSSSLIKLFTELIKQNISRTWIAGDGWSTSSDVAGLDNIDKVGPVLGYRFKTRLINGFEKYLQNLQPVPNSVNTFINEYKELRFGCTDEYLKYAQCIQTGAEMCNPSLSVNIKSPLACSVKNVSLANDDFLTNNTYTDSSYNVYLAVTAIAQAIQNITCNNGSCENDISFPPYQLLSKLKEMQFSLDTGPFSFEDLRYANGYHLVSWKMINGRIQYQTVGEYDIPDERITINETLLPWDSKDKIPFSNCSYNCKPGQFKKLSTISCCYKCDSCHEGYYSQGIDMSECAKCPEDQWSSNGSAKCENRTIQFFGWTNPFAIVLTCFSAFGFVTVLAVEVIFLKHLNTPAVKAAGGIYSCIMNVSLLFSFVSTVFFIGKPTDITCQIRQVMYGVSFTLCVSCVLQKSLRILLAFELGKRPSLPGLKITYQPAMFIFVATTIQILICMVWLILGPPSLSKIDSMPRILLLQCTEGSNAAFGIMLGYIGVLAFVCFAVAFKGRNLPSRYNEAQFITFSMLIYLFVWIAFIPIYVTTVGLYLPAVQVVAILASNYGIISCHLLPTCYIICFKRESNTRDNYLQSVSVFVKAQRPVFSVSKYVENPRVCLSIAKACQTNSMHRLKQLSLRSCVRRRRHSTF